MTDSQSNRLDMYLVVQDFYESNQATIDTVPARASAFAQLVTNITDINKEVAGQSTNTTGVAQDKSALRDTLDNIAATALATAKAWAKNRRLPVSERVRQRKSKGTKVKRGKRLPA